MPRKPSLHSSTAPRDLRGAMAVGSSPPCSAAAAAVPIGFADDQLLSERQLAARWNCSPKTLRNHRSRRRGCPFVRLGRLVRYPISVVLAYEQAGGVRP